MKRNFNSLLMGFTKMATVMICFMASILTTSVHAQDPAQYGTPFTGVPNRMDANIYQLNFREYTPQRTIVAAKNNLQRIKDLGINVVYVMPFATVTTDPTKGADKSPYSVKDLKGVDPGLGTLQDIRDFVAQCHTLGMAVLFDFVPNQTAWDHPWITQHNDWYAKNPDGTIRSPDAGSPGSPFYFTDVAEVNLNNAAASAAMIDAMRYWIFAANFDGVRLDWADKAGQTFNTNFVANMRGIAGRTLLLLAEGSNEGTTSNCFTCGDNQPGAHWTQGYDYIYGNNFYWNIMYFPNKDNLSATNINGVTEGEYLGASSSQMVARMITNHDNYNQHGSPFSFLNGGRNAAMAYFALSALHRGVPFIYNGVEVGNTNPLPYPWRTGTINWTQDLTVYTEMQKILNFRNGSNVIKRGQPTTYTTSANNDVIAFAKINGSEKVVMIMNTRNSSKNFTIPAGMAGSYVNPFNNNAAVILTSGQSVTLNAYQYLVYTNTNVPPVDVINVTLSPASASVKAGLKVQLTASITPSNATNQTLTWNSSNPTVAAVDGNGLVTALAVGTSTITATSNNGKTGTSVITVTPASTFTVHYYNSGNWPTVYIYAWSATPAGVRADDSWPGVVTTSEGSGWFKYTFTNVDNTNLIFNDGTINTPVTPTNKTADLNRAGTNGWYYGGAWYNSQPATIAPTSVSVSPTSATVAKGATRQLTATITPSNATNQNVFWTSSAPSVATVNASGLVSAVGAGTATITVTTQDGGKTATCAITVPAPPRTPYAGVIGLPGTVQAENFDNGGEGVGYHDNEAANQGGQYRLTEGVDIEGSYNVGWTNAGEWLEYTVNVAIAGNYDFAFTIANGSGSASALHVEFGGVNKTGTVGIQNTGGWANWQTATKTAVALSAGQQIMRIYFESGNINLDKVAIIGAVGGGTYFTIKNTWKGTYLFDNGANVGYGASVANDTYKWTQEVVAGTSYVLFKNKSTNQYMYVENQTGSVQAAGTDNGQWSAHWAIENVDGTNKRLVNRWLGKYIHVENQTGSAQYGDIQSAWTSAQWQLAPASGRLAAEEGETEASNAVNIYPNPSSGKYFNIHVSGLQNNEMASVTLHDINGKVAFETKVRESARVEHNLPTGLYFVKVRANKLNITKKLAIE